MRTQIQKERLQTTGCGLNVQIQGPRCIKEGLKTGDSFSLAWMGTHTNRMNDLKNIKDNKTGINKLVNCRERAAWMNYEQDFIDKDGGLI